MSNIYDTANELSRGLRELPEYKAVKAAKDAIQADEQASKIFADYIAFQQEIQENALLSDFFAKQQQLSIYLSDIEKIVFEPVSELLK